MKFYKKLLGLALALSLVTGCSQSGGVTDTVQNSESSDGGAAAAPLKKIEMTAGNTSVTTVATVLAKYGGFFEEEGLDVNLTPANTNADNLSALTTGKTQACSGGGSAAPLAFIDEGNDIVVIGGGMTEGAALVGLPDRADEFKELNAETLAGKKIGVTRAQPGDIVFRGWLYENGIDLDTIEFVELDSGSSVIEAVKKGAVDIGMESTTFRETAEKQGLVVVKHIDELKPGFICCRILTTQKNIDADRDTYVSLIKAHIKAYQYFRNNKEETLSLLKNYLEMDDDLIVSQLYDYGHLGISPNPSKDNVIDFYKSMTAIGYVSGEKNIADHVDSTIFEDAITQILEEYPDDPVYNELYEEFKATNTK